MNEVVVLARLIWWQSQRLLEAGDALVAEMLRCELAFAQEGARG